MELSNPMVFHDIDLNIICAIAQDAGSAIMDIYDQDFAVEFKDDHSPLTSADKASHDVIVANLKRQYPGIPVLSEEGQGIPFAERSPWSRFWLVDPLDGTKEFIKRNGEFTVNIALVVNGRAVAGVVYVPVQKTLFFGAQGMGAWKIVDDLQPKAIGVRSAVKEMGLTVVMSRSHPSPELSDYLEEVNISEAMPVGSSLKFCVIAEGKADLYPRLGPTMEWDTAAGHAIVEAAGGTVLQMDGSVLCYNKESLLNPHFVVQGGQGKP